MDLVSVVLPTRDRVVFLRQALGSALAQEHHAIEVLVVDDGSTDGTAEAVAAIRDERVQIIRHSQPLGVSAARNSGIARARGHWVAFLDDDDLWAPEKLRAQLDAAAVSGAGWVYGGEVEVDVELRVVDGAPPPTPDVVMSEVRRYNAVPAGCSNVVVRRTVLEAVGPFDPGLTNQEDWDMWIRLAALGRPARVGDPVVALRSHGGNTSRDQGRMLAELHIIAERHAGVSVDWARHHRWTAWAALEDGHRVRALRHYLAAVRHGDHRSLARATVAVAAPRLAVRRRRRMGPSPWAAAAQQWLDAVAVR